jgi:DNA-binding beta-propeller fold protein YncE
MFFELETFAGTGVNGMEDGPVASASFTMPSWLVATPTGTVYVTETFANGIRKIEGGMVSTLTSRTDGNADGPLSTALFRGPSGIVCDQAGNLYVGDQNNHRIRKIDVSGNVTTAAGPTGDQLLYGWVDELFELALFTRPMALAIDADDSTVYVTEHNRIRRFPLRFKTGVTLMAVRTVAAVGIEGFADGPPTVAQFNQPNGIAVTQTGDLFVADKHNHRIRRVSPSGMVTTVAGNGIAASPADQSQFLDGRPALQASFEGPFGLAVDPTGMVWVADGSHVRMYSPLSDTVSTVCSDKLVHLQPIKFDGAFVGIALSGGKILVTASNKILALTPQED